MFAGTPAVAVTLWSVESQSAKELNVRMYRDLSRETARAAALREIKLALLRGEKGEKRDPLLGSPGGFWGWRIRQAWTKSRALMVFYLWPI